MRRRAASVGAVVAAALSVASPASAQSVDAIDSLALGLRAEVEPPGVVVGAIGPDGTVVRAYGVRSAGAGEPLRPDTRFEIGSITKILTALLLAEMAESGELRLDEPIDGCLPAGTAAPRHRDGRITFEQLATHSSGLPRLPGNLLFVDPSNPYARYGEEELLAFLDVYEPGDAPGTVPLYSNVGSGLLGYLLGRCDGGGFGQALRERVLEPLGMTATYLPDPDEHPEDPGSAVGHVGRREVPYWTFDVLAGAGGLRSTAEDMLGLVRAHLEPGRTPLAGAIRLTREPRVRVSAAIEIALGWFASKLEPGVPVYWHTGGTGGFRSFIGVAPVVDAGVVVLVNGAVPMEPVERLGREVLRLAVPAPNAEPDPGAVHGRPLPSAPGR